MPDGQNPCFHGPADGATAPMAISQKLQIARVDGDSGSFLLLELSGVGVLPPQRFDDQTLPNRPGRDLDPLGRTLDHCGDRLQVRLERAAGARGHLRPDAAKVLRPPADADPVPGRRANTSKMADSWHGGESIAPPPDEARCVIVALGERSSGRVPTAVARHAGFLQVWLRSCQCRG